MISVVIPTFNVGKYIGEAIESVLQQTYEDWELIIVDDCSTDNTAEIVESYQQRCDKIRFIKRRINSGGARKPRYDGILAAQGEYVSHIDGDDFIDKHYLEKMLATKRNTQADLVLSKLVYCNEKGILDTRQIPNKEFDFNTILSGESACGMTIGSWQLNMAGLLADTSFYQNFVKRVYDDDCDSCFNDELDYRKLLLSVSTVAFSSTQYYYRQHEMSVVHLPLSQFVDRLNQVMPLYAFITANIHDETIIRKMKDNFLQSLYLAESTYLEHKSSMDKTQRHLAQTKIRKAYSFLQANNIDGVGLKFYLISKHYYLLVILSQLRVCYSKIKSSF